MMTAPPLLFRFRETVATMPSVLALALLVLLGVQQTVKLQRHTDETPVQISLVTQELPPAPPTPPAPPQPPRPVEPPKPQVTPPVPAKAAPTPVKSSQPSPTPSPTTSAVAELPAVSAPTPAPAPQQTQPAAPPAPPSPPVPARANPANVEAEYVARLRSHLNSIKRYPTGREASQQRPQGTVRVWFVLRRDGSVVDIGVEQSSNSMLLDEAARKTINRASFNAFPEHTWTGESTHRFTAELEFFPAAG